MNDKMKEKKVNINSRDGITFTFEDNGNEIVLWGGLFGQERLTVNGELVSEKRSFSTNSTTEFSIGDQDYSINIDLLNFFSGPYVATLSKNGQAIKRTTLYYKPIDEKSGQEIKPPKSFFRKIWPNLLIVIFGFIAMYFDWFRMSIFPSLPEFFVVINILAIILVSLSLRFKPRAWMMTEEAL